MPEQNNIRRLRRDTMSLACELTEDELREYGTDVARTVHEIQVETDRQTNIKAQLKSRLTELQSKASRLAGIVNAREEWRDIEIEIVLDYDTQEHQKVRLDTGEIIRRRAMREDERQMVIDEPEEGDQADETAVAERNARIHELDKDLKALARELIGSTGDVDDVVGDTYAAVILNAEDPDLGRAHAGLEVLADAGIVRPKEDSGGDWIILMTLADLDAILADNSEVAA